MTLPQMITELSEIAPQFGLTVRLENGRFAGGLCIVNGEQLIVLNKRHPPERQFAVLAAALRSAPLDDVYVKPSIRRALEEAWERLDRGVPAGGDEEAGDE
ncbi:MAG TPA: hypothetical protein VF190_13735 [Rhodothermales bacterium]